MIERLKRNPHLPGFVIGFAGITFVAMVLLGAWGILRGEPAPTLVPTGVALADRVTVVPPATDQGETPSPEQDVPPTAPPSPEPSQTPTPAAPREHTVQEGDTLFDLSLEYDVSVETIQAANNLQSDTIVAGQKLIIPTGPLPTPTPYAEGDMLIHTVSSGETLIELAAHYDVTVEAIQQANDLEGEIIQQGQQLRIPTGEAAPPAPSATITGTPAAEKPWQPSILEGDLASAYPLTLAGERFTMHYQPDTPADRDPDAVYALVAEALAHIEAKLDVSMAQPFDVYVAGSLFAAPDLALRGRSFSSQRRNFYLFDESGTPSERRYIVTHELTHLVIWNTVSAPSSVMLHEGLAVYTGIEAMESAGFIPLQQFCAAYQQAEQLPRVSGGRSFLGHIRDLDLYFAAGCFVEYLIETYGLDDFKQLFQNGNYTGIYGRTLSQLETEWISTLDAVAGELTFTPTDLVDVVAEVTDGYQRIFAGFSGTPAQMEAYRALDKARIDALQGRFDNARAQLDEFETLLRGE